MKALRFLLPLLALTASPLLAQSKLNLGTQVKGTLPVANGGTGATSLTAHGVVLGNGTSAANASSAGTSGQPFLSGGASADGAYGALDLSTSAVTGNLGTTHLNSGTGASAGTYWRGDGTWASPTGGVSAGNPYEPAWTIPTASNFTLQNAGSASFADTSTGVFLTAPGNGGVSDQIRFLKYTGTVSSFTSFTITVRGRPVINSINSTTEAIILRNSTSGKILIYGTYSNVPADLVQNWNSYSSFNASLFNVNRSVVISQSWWKRLSLSSGTMTFQYSPDGLNWVTVGTATVASFLGSIDELGIGCTAQASNGGTSLFNSFTLQ